MSFFPPMDNEDISDMTGTLIDAVTPSEEHAFRGAAFLLSNATELLKLGEQLPPEALEALAVLRQQQLAFNAAFEAFMQARMRSEVRVSFEALPGCFQSALRMVAETHEATFCSNGGDTMRIYSVPQDREAAFRGELEGLRSIAEQCNVKFNIL